jgi:hypothetical protein
MIQDASRDNRKSNVSPKIVGEWSLAFDDKGDNFLPMTGNHASAYYRWFAAQQRKYEELNRRVFWTWKQMRIFPTLTNGIIKVNALPCIEGMHSLTS